VTSGWCSPIARTWWPSEPGSSTGSGGISARSTRHWNPQHEDSFNSSTRWRWSAVWRGFPAWSPVSPGSSLPAVANGQLGSGSSRPRSSSWSPPWRAAPPAAPRRKPCASLRRRLPSAPRRRGCHATGAERVRGLIRCRGADGGAEPPGRHWQRGRKRGGSPSVHK
jgi:hypothetical protein